MVYIFGTVWTVIVLPQLAWLLLTVQKEEMQKEEIENSENSVS